MPSLKVCQHHCLRPIPQAKKDLVVLVLSYWAYNWGEKMEEPEEKDEDMKQEGGDMSTVQERDCGWYPADVCQYCTDCDEDGNYCLDFGIVYPLVTKALCDNGLG